MAEIVTTSPGSAANESKRQRYDRIMSTLKNDRDSSWRPHWQDIADYLLPRRVRFNNSTDRNKGDKKNTKIVNSTATLALRTARSGMMSGITSPARPWFRLTTPDPDLAEFGPVKEWLHIITRRMFEVYARSNFYNALPTLYGDILGFGTGTMSLLEDMEDVIRCFGFPLGSYVLATSERGNVDTFMREFTMTVRQLVMRFGDRYATPATRWLPFSQTVRQQWDAGNYEVPIEVAHVVAPNMELDERRLESKYNKRFASCYYEQASKEYAAPDRERFLRESGFDLFPILAARWDLASPDDVYGSPCPGMEALGDTKALQLLERRKAQAVEKVGNPPLRAPSTMRNAKVSTIPGDITYEDVREGMKGIEPVYQIQPDIKAYMIDVEAHQKRIQRAFFEDLFLMLANDARATPPTAEEIRAREGERLLMLGPVLERMNDDVLNPAIDLTFAYMDRQGLVPPAPPELEGVKLKVEYISVLAQAQKMVSIASMDRFYATVKGLAGLQLEAQREVTVLDKVDLDQSVDEYGDQLGVAPRVIVPDDKVVQIRKDRAQRQAAAQRVAAVEQAAGAAKDLAAADTGGKNALTDLIALQTGGRA